MKFKSKEIQDEYRSGKLHPKLKEVLLVIEVVYQLYGIKNGLTITCIYRDKDHPNYTGKYHSKWQAVDFRVRGVSSELMGIVGAILKILRRADNCIQSELEINPPHWHLEYDDGSL